MSGLLRRIAAAGAAALVACVALGALPTSGTFPSGILPAASAQPSAEASAHSDALRTLGSCVSTKGKLDVVLMVDETESLIHHTAGGSIDRNTPGSDAQHNRVPAAQSFVNQLLAKHNDEGVDVRIRVAGFGQEYKSGATDPTYGEWVRLDDASIQGVKATIAGFADRTTEQYTNYANAFEGAYQDFPRSGAADSCKMLVTFTDGALTAQEGPEAAQDAICRPNGITDKLRSAGITNIGIGLSDPKNPSDFQLFEGITQGTGTPCGDLAPNGAFFPADSVGSLFASFHQALSTGGMFAADTVAGDPFEFVLDDSIDSVRFTAIAKDDLGPNAKLKLIAPDGSEAVLEGEGSREVGGAEVRWSSGSEPVQMAVGEMHLPEAASWAGQWKLQFTGFGEDRGDHRVFNSVKIQPDLQVQLVGPDGLADGSLNVRSNEEVAVQLIDRHGKPRKLDGTATVHLGFAPTGDGARTELLSASDISGGVPVPVPLEQLRDLPAAGVLQAQVNIVTAPAGPHPGTALDPVTSDVPAVISRTDMPELPGALNFTMETPQIVTSVPVKGPGRVWIPQGTTLQTETLPEGVASLNVSSQYAAADTALELGQDEEAELPVTISVEQLRDGVVSGSIPVRVARADGTQETTVPVAATGNLMVPLNKTAFTLAFLAALVLGLLIPLALLYLVRYLTGRIPAQYFGAQRIPLRFEGTSLRFNGAFEPVIDLDEASRNEVAHNGRVANVLGHRLQVRSFQRNPFAASKVVVHTKPSVGDGGDQLGGQGVLPLAVQGHWFIAAVAGNLELIVLPRLPIDYAAAERLAKDIAQRAPDLAARIQQQIPAPPQQSHQVSTPPHPQPPQPQPQQPPEQPQQPQQPQQDSWGSQGSWDSPPSWGDGPRWN